ncbi:MAG: DUF4189 domain-containing protein [Myxococcota bacterium]
MGGSRSGFGGVLLVALVGLSCASWFSAQLDAPAGARLEDAWRLYRISEDDKAMAIAIDEATGRRVWGMRYGYLSQDSASQGALEECQENAQSRGVAKRCHLLAVGNHRAPGAVAACADGRAPESFCTLMNDLVPPGP